MAVNGNHASVVMQLDRPPGKPDSSFVLPFLGGENIYIPCSKSATRLLVTGKETNNAFAVVGSGGTAAPPIGFHFHRETHDVFLCLKGHVNVWAGEKCRTMGPGDFASVPPNVVHQYQFVGDYTEFLGLIVPGGWEEFFRFLGEPYSGPLFPLSDDRNPFEVLIPKLKAAAEVFDLVPMPQHPQFDPQPWPTDGDNALPEATEPYFLRSGSGPKYLIGGTLCRPLIARTQSAGKFSIASIEGSSHHASPLPRSITFREVHHCVQVSEGYVEFTVGGSTARLGAGETLYIPSGTQFGFRFASKLAKAYVFSNGGGVSELLCRVGREYAPPLIPGKEVEWDAGELSRFEKELGFTLS